MAESEHLCKQDMVENVTNAKLKKLLLGRHRQDDPFKCGGCTATFTTICCLHLHCLKHNGGGSYYFDSLTRTAFPKYDTTCVYTQVSYQDIMSDIAELERDVTVNTNSEIVKPLRISRRIALRKNSKSKETIYKLKRIKVLKNKPFDETGNNEKQIEESVSTKEDGTEVVRTDMKQTPDKGYETTTDSVETSIPESDSLLDNESDVKKQNQIQVADKNNLDTIVDLSEEESMKTSIKCKRKRNVLELDNKSCTTINSVEAQDSHRKNDIVESDGHEKDELTASEVLLAISKGDNSDLSRNELGQQNTPLKACDEPIFASTCQENSYSRKPHESDRLTRSKRVSKKPKQTELVVECETCGKKGTKGMLRYHKYLHMDGKSFTCDVCGQPFKTPRSLAIHKKQHEDKQYQCDYCPAAFYRKQYLETHLLKHSGENPFMCDLCGKSYRDRSHLKRHIKHVHDKKRDFGCDICGEKFFRSDHLKNHRLRHFEADKKCPFCNRMFKHPEDLARHTRTHTGKKDWYCHICSHGFVAVIPYYAHMAKKHGISRDEAKIWKDKCREDLRNNQHLQKKLSSRGQDPSKSRQNIQNLASIDNAKLVMSSVSVADSPKVLHIKTSDMSTYVDLPASEMDTGERNDTDCIEEGYGEGNLLIKLASSSDNVKTFTDEDLLHVPRTVISDLIQGSDNLDCVGQTGDGLTVDIQDRFTGSETDFNVIIAVNEMEFDGETVMFIDGDQCQSEVIIDN